MCNFLIRSLIAFSFSLQLGRCGVLLEELKFSELTGSFGFGLFPGLCRVGVEGAFEAVPKGTVVLEDCWCWAVPRFLLDPVSLISFP